VFEVTNEAWALTDLNGGVQFSVYRRNLFQHAPLDGLHARPFRHLRSSKLPGGCGFLCISEYDMISHTAGNLGQRNIALGFGFLFV